MCGLDLSASRPEKMLLSTSYFALLRRERFRTRRFRTLPVPIATHTYVITFLDSITHFLTSFDYRFYFRSNFLLLRGQQEAVRFDSALQF